MPRAANAHPSLTLAAAIFLGTVVALSGSGYEQYFVTPVLEDGDTAVNALQVDNAKHFSELYGNYSRFEFNHPGPAFFYAYAAGEWLFHDLLGVSPSPGNAHQLAGMVLQSAFFSLAIALLAGMTRWRATAPLLLLAAALYFGPLGEPFVSIWPPHVLLMPFLCFLAACVSIASGHIRHLPVAVLAGGFLVHGHVAQPLQVGILGGLTAVLAGRRLRHEEPDATWRARFAPFRVPFAASAALAFLFALPIVIDVVTRGTRGNIATILGRFYANTGDQKSLLQSLLYFASFATGSRDQETLFTTLGPQVSAFFAEHAVRVDLWAALFVLPPVLAWLLRRRLDAAERRFFAATAVVLAGAVVGSLLWGIAQAGDMAHFNGFYYYAVYFFALVPAISLVARFVEPVAHAPLLAACCATAAVSATWSFRLPRLSGDVATGITIRDGVERARLRNPTTRPRLLEFEHRYWPEAASVALQLQRDGERFYVTPWWEFMFGSRHDSTRLGDAPEEAASVWWIAGRETGGLPITPELAIHTAPAGIAAAGGAEIQFHGGGNAFRYVVSGISVGNTDYAVTNERRVAMELAPLPTASDVRLLLDAMAADDAGETAAQPADVYFNGEPLGRITAGERAIQELTVPADLWNSRKTATLELRFPDAIASRSYKRPRYESWSAWRLWSIRFEEAH